MPECDMYLEQSGNFEIRSCPGFLNNHRESLDLTTLSRQFSGFQYFYGTQVFISILHVQDENNELQTKD